jgi:hypothetical protein
MKETKYYIYHIPDYIRKNGKIGKIGITENLSERSRHPNSYNGMYNLILLETHTCIYKASEREIELQKEYGYPVDHTPYWKSVSVRKSPDVRSKLKEACSGENHVMYGKDQPKETRIKMSSSRGGRPFSQYTLDGTWVRDWEIVRDASRFLNKHHPSISRCLKGELGTAWGFIWRYKD